jgi:hypothetical protein
MKREAERGSDERVLREEKDQRRAKERAFVFKIERETRGIELVAQRGKR